MTAKKDYVGDTVPGKLARLLAVGAEAAPDTRKSAPRETDDHGRPPAVGQTWGKYLIEKRLGRGVQAEVFQAYDRFGAAGQVALKVGLVRAAPGQAPEWTTAVSHTHRGNRGWEPHYLALDLDGAKPGPRDFRVVIKDLHDQQEAMTSTIFRVMW